MTAVVGTLYQPGKFIRVAGGATQSKFEDPTDLSKAVVLPETYMRCLSELSHSLTLFNYSGQDLIFVIDEKAAEGDDDINNFREEDVELAGTFVPRGESVVVPLYPRYYIMTVESYSIGETGKKYLHSREGIKLDEVEGKTISILRGRTKGSITFEYSEYLGDNYCIVVNKTNRTINVNLDKPKDPSTSSSAQLEEEKVGREPDFGGLNVQQITIEPNGEWHFKNPPEQFIVRALQRRFNRNGRHQYASNSSVPGARNYIQLAYALGAPGSAVGAFQTESCNGGVDMESYPCNEIKPVSGKIAIIRKENV